MAIFESAYILGTNENGNIAQFERATNEFLYKRGLTPRRLYSDKKTQQNIVLFAHNEKDFKSIEAFEQAKKKLVSPVGVMCHRDVAVCIFSAKKQPCLG